MNLNFQGEVCVAGSRVYVQEGIYDEFVKKAVVAAQNWKVGDPFDVATNMGPQVHRLCLHFSSAMLKFEEIKQAKTSRVHGRKGSDKYNKFNLALLGSRLIRRNLRGSSGTLSMARAREQLCSPAANLPATKDTTSSLPYLQMSR
jgi:hypothetical protein